MPGRFIKGGYMADRIRTTLTINKATHEYLRQFAPNDHAIGSFIDSLGVCPRMSASSSLTPGLAYRSHAQGRVPPLTLPCLRNAMTTLQHHAALSRAISSPSMGLHTAQPGFSPRP